MKLSNSFKRGLTIALVGLVTLSTMVGCTSTYDANEKDMNLGVSVIKDKMKSDGTDLIFQTSIVLNEMYDCNGEKVFDDAKSDKQNDDMLYGILRDSSDTFRNVDEMDVDELMDKLGLNEANTEDMNKFKEDIAPTLEEISNVLDEITMVNFDGTVDKERYDKFQKLFNEYMDRYIEYDRRSMEYRLN